MIGFIAFALCLIATAAGFIGWALWSLFWHLYDSRMERSLRIKNSELDAAYRTGQFYVPPTLRDCK